MAKRRKRRVSGLGRKAAKGRGGFCVTIRRSSKKSKGSASTRCFTSSAAANKFLHSAIAGKGKAVKSALVYRRGRAA